MNAKRDVIDRAYSPETWQEMFPEIMERIGRELEAAQSQSRQKTIDRLAPEEQLQFWQEDFGGETPENLNELVDKVLSHSINFHSKGYMGHQVAVTLPVTVLTSALMAYMNNCTTVYGAGETDAARAGIQVLRGVRFFLIFFTFGRLSVFLSKSSGVSISFFRFGKYNL